MRYTPWSVFQDGSLTVMHESNTIIVLRCNQPSLKSPRIKDFKKSPTLNKDENSQIRPRRKRTTKISPSSTKKTKQIPITVVKPLPEFHPAYPVSVKDPLAIDKRSRPIIKPILLYSIIPKNHSNTSRKSPIINTSFTN
jgi:hypothetical protein